MPCLLAKSSKQWVIVDFPTPGSPLNSIIVFLGMISYMFLIVSCMSDCNSGNIKIPDQDVNVVGEIHD